MKFKICGCRIYISFYFFAAAAAIAILCRSSTFFCGIAAAAIHECGHIAAIALSPHTSVSRISLGALGIRISAMGDTTGPMIIISGVLANILLAVVSAVLLSFFPKSDVPLQLLTANICLAGCNILPIEPLDGGQLLRTGAEKHFLPDKADSIVLAVSLCFLIPLAIFGFFIVLCSEGNFSLLILCLWLLAGILKTYLL